MSVVRMPATFWVVLMLPVAVLAAPANGKIIEKQDVVYGRVHGAGLLADIAYPESDKPIPAIISVHGGRWRGGAGCRARRWRPATRTRIVAWERRQTRAWRRASSP